MTEGEYIVYLVEAEAQAIEDYKHGIEGYTKNNQKLKQMFSHILKEEEEHYKMLDNYLKEGK